MDESFPLKPSLTWFPLVQFPLMHFFFSFTDDEDLSTISDDFESMSIQSSTEDSQNEQSCSSRYILILLNFDQKFDPKI